MNKIYIKDILEQVFGDNYSIACRLSGGMNNISYLIDYPNGKKYILHIPNGKINKLINRKNEQLNQKLTSDLGLTGVSLYFDVNRGIRIYEYIPGTTLDKCESVDYEKMVDLLKKLHNSPTFCQNEFNPIQRLFNYENLALTYQKESDRYRFVRDFFSAHIDFLEYNHRKVPCHNDFDKKNIVVDEQNNYKIIDFEYMGNNDEIYDIASFGNDSIDEAEELLKHYFNTPNKTQIERFYLWRVFISLLWHNLAIINHHQNKSRFVHIDFLAIADHYLNNAEEAKRRYLSVHNLKD